MAWGREHPEIAAVYTTKGFATVLTFGYRGVAVALENPCIQEGVRITKEVLSSLKGIGDQAGVRIGVVLIPTKETVYAAADSALHQPAAAGFAAMLRNEAEIKQDMLGHCQKIGLVCVDATSRLVDAAKKGVLVYKSDSDGHPMAAGYRQIAYAAREALTAPGGAPNSATPRP